ncbi:unnamed protein product [Knipowitschia caucasica]
MQLRAHEAAVLEKAVRLAVESVMNVLSAVNSARVDELQRRVHERDRDVRVLQERVREAEKELRLMKRPWWCPGADGSGVEEAGVEASGLNVSGTEGPGVVGSGAPTAPGPLADTGEHERSGDCELRVSVALQASLDPSDGLEQVRPRSQDHNESLPPPQEQAEPPCPPDGTVLLLPQCAPYTQVKQEAEPTRPQCLSPGPQSSRPQCFSPGPQSSRPQCFSPGPQSSRPQCLSPGPQSSRPQCLSPGPQSSRPQCLSPTEIKQEPFCPDFELMSQEDVPAMFLQRALSEDVSHRVEEILGQCELWPSVCPEAESASALASVPRPLYTGDCSSSRKDSSLKDQSEEAMKRRRASWRAASRRYYARKMARQQTRAGPSSSSPHLPQNFPHHYTSSPGLHRLQHRAWGGYVQQAPVQSPLRVQQRHPAR